MKQILILSVSILLSASACDSGETNADLEGIYSFKSLAGEYCEMWVGDGKLATVKGEKAAPYVMRTRQNADTVFMYEYVEGNLDEHRPMSWFLILEKDGKETRIKQDENVNTLTRLKKESPEIKKSRAFTNKMKEDFTRRRRLNS